MRLMQNCTKYTKFIITKEQKNMFINTTANTTTNRTEKKVDKSKAEYMNVSDVASAMNISYANANKLMKREPFSRFVIRLGAKKLISKVNFYKIMTDLEGHDLKIS